MALTANETKSGRNQNSVLRQLAALQKLSEPELREKWRDLYGSEPPYFRPTFLRKRLAFRIQELFYGTLSDESVKKLSEMALNDPMSNISRHEKNPKGNNADEKTLPGTRLLREWNGRQYEVIAKEKGFEYDGMEFRSLTAVARKITGVQWNGPVFFGLKKSRRKEK